MYINLILLFILFSCPWAFAQEQDDKWLKLLHYSDPLFYSPKSDIITKDFFLADDGNTNPEAELQSTIEGLRNSPEISCRFPARRLYLEKKGYRFPSVTCKEYDNWSRGNSIKSASLIFATGFLGNPASYFGHPLLKFNYKDERSPLDLLDTAINYGAFTPANVDALSYAVQGMFGGYEAGFTSADFFFHKNNYSELELRDLWEYELDLTPEQVQFMYAHVWELQNARIRYYFFKDNCAYRMGDLLEIVTGKEFVSEYALAAIPSALFHQLYEYNLVKDIKQLKSRQTRMREKVLTLKSSERKYLKEVSENADYVRSDEFKALDEYSRIRILETALDYYSFRLVGENTPENKESKRKILKERIALPPVKIGWKEIPKRPPHEAQKPILTLPGYFYSEKFGEASSLRFRPVFYDLVSPDTGRPVYSSLAVMDFELNATDERLWLKNLNLVSIESLNLSSTNLKGDGGWAWRVNAGADQMNLACNTCSVAKLEFGAGLAFEISRYFAMYAMFDPRLQSNFEDSGFVSIKPNIGVLLTVSDDLRFHAATGRRFYLDSDYDTENLYLVEGRLGSARTWDFRFNFQQHIDRRYGLGVGLYW